MKIKVKQVGQACRKCGTPVKKAQHKKDWRPGKNRITGLNGGCDVR
jgi:ribosomal protein S27AE